MKKHIKAELLMLKQNGLATQKYKQKLNRLIDSPTITFDDWRKTGTFCNGSDISKMYNLGTLSTHVVRYAGGIVIECDHVYKDNTWTERKPIYTFQGYKATSLKEVEKVAWEQMNNETVINNQQKI